MKIFDSIAGLFTREKPLGAGVYHRRVTGEDGNNYRLHLRVEEGGAGILSINAAKILHLNPTAAELAKLIIEEDTAGAGRQGDHEALPGRHETGRRRL